MQYFYILLLFFAKITWDMTDAANVHFQVNNINENNITCNDGITKNITELEDGSITIGVAFYNERRIESIKCHKPNTEFTYLYLENSEIQTSGHRYTLPVQQDMGMVKCTIRIYNKEVSNNNQDLIDSEANNFYAAYCYIKVHVRISKPHHTILVNNMRLATTRTTIEDENFDHTAIYYYAVGDLVNVSCIILEDNDSYNILLHYDYAEKLDGIYNKILQKMNPLGYEFSTILRPEHHNTVMICTCKGTHDTTKIKVTFNQKEFFDDGYIVVNGHIGRQVFEEKPKLIYDYVFIMYQPVIVSCRSNKTDFSINGNCSDQHPVYVSKQAYECNVYVQSSSENVVCKLCNKGEVVQTFQISIAPFLQKFTENLPLAMPQLPKSNIVLQLHDYENGNTWIHYEYDEGENITLECCETTTSGGCTIINMEYHFNGTVIETNKKITLTSAHDGVHFSSRLNVKQLTVKFSMKKIITDVRNITSPESPATSPDSMGWIIGVICGLVCIILLCIAIVIYKRSKQRAAIPEGRNENEQILHNDDNFISINNVQEDTYANLLRIQKRAVKNNDPVSGQDGSYANLSKIKNTATKTDDKTIYSEPVNVQGDTYANLSKFQDRAAKNDEKSNNYGPANIQDGPYANVSKLQDRAAINDEKAANCGPANIQDGPYANLSNIQDRAGKNDEKAANCGPNKQDNYYDQLQIIAEKPDLNYSELDIDQPNSSRLKRTETETPYVEVKEMYAQVLPKSARKNRNSYDNVFGNIRYVNSKDSEYVEPTYCQAYKK